MTDRPDPDERFRIEGDPEDALRALMRVDSEGDEQVRWYIVLASTGEPELPPNPPDGFRTEAQAVEFHRTVLQGDTRLTVVPVRIP